MDVVEPGKSAPSASARPIIVTNRPMIRQDPMVASGDTPPVATRAAEPAQVGDKTTVTRRVASKLVSAHPDELKMQLPIAAKVSPEKAEELDEDLARIAVEHTVPAPPAEDASKAPAATMSSTATSPPAQDPEKESEAASDTDGQLAPNKALDDAEQKAAEEREVLLAEQEKVIASKQYVLPINAAKHRRGLYVSLLFLALTMVLAVVWLDVVLDAGIVKIAGLHPATHFFGQ